jgi:TM2 domain-containing membrane protein YozV
MYCSKCGNQIREGDQFCDRCGEHVHGGGQGAYQSQPYPGHQSSATYTRTPDRKDPVTAVILSFLIPGVGQIYVGRVLRGVLILLLLIPLYGLGWVLFRYSIAATPNLDDFMLASSLIMLVNLIIYIWQIVDANRLAEKYYR